MTYQGPESAKPPLLSETGPWLAVEHAPRCKHHRPTCADCGIGERDVLHKTVGGRGAVARLRRAK